MSGAPGTPTRVLLVDDIEENLIALEALVRRHGVEVSVAHSGKEALELLLVHDYALALLDVNMPEIDGFQLAELMRGSSRTKSVPIIFVTAAYDAARVFRGYDAGAVDFLVKPVDPRILRHKVDTFVKLHESRRQLADQLAQVHSLSDQLAESLRLHETFVAALNHDLRSPLSAITVGLGMLAEDITDPAQRETLRRVEGATDRMAAMLDQLYELARARVGGGLVLDPKPGDLGAVVKDVIREAELRRENALVLDVAGDPRGTWDLSRLSRVAANLISNAMQHGAGASSVHVVVDGSDQDQVRLAVTNAGVIPAELLPRIFEPFKRGEASTNGLGLGLYIVREIAAAHGGDVTVTSDPAVGTQFEVRLPRHVQLHAN
jgi:signal transduction histidine kinase